MQEGKSVLAFPDGTKLVMPGKPVSKGVTVLKINKQQVNDHSYTFVCQLKNLRQDEDEGYNSRSSMDSEGEEHPAPSPGGSDSVLGSPNPETPDATAHGNTDLPSPIGSQGPLSPKGVTSPTSNKPAKIVIVKRDPSVKQEISPKQLEDSKLMPSPGTSGGVGANKNVVLRTLLKQKPVLNVFSSNNSKMALSHASLLSVASTSHPNPPTDDNSEGKQIPDSEISQNVITETVNPDADQQLHGLESSASNVIKSILTASEDEESKETRTENTETTVQDTEERLSEQKRVESPLTVEPETASNEGNLTQGKIHSIGKEEGNSSSKENEEEVQKDESTPVDAGQCDELQKDGDIDSKGETSDISKASEEAAESVTALDHEVTQITSEMMESPEVTQTHSVVDTGREQTHQYIIQDDLPPSEKLEQETTTQSSDAVATGDDTNKDNSSTDSGAILEGQGETVHITNTEETDCVSVGSPEVVMSDVVASPLGTHTSPTSTVQLLVTSSPPKSASLSNLTGLLKAQQPRLTTKVNKTLGTE